MKLLVTSDLHYNLQQYDWLLQTGEFYDYVVIVGDLLNIAGFLEHELQITVVSEYLVSLSQKTKVVVCSGNHDGEVKNSAGEFTAAWLRSLHSDTLTVDGQCTEDEGTLFSICPWWDGPHSRGEMVAMLERHSQLKRERWIWLHHAPPDACRVSWTGKRHGGDSFLNGLIEKYEPTIVLSGHIHTPPFYQASGWIDRLHKTWVLNPGNQPGSIPTTIQLDMTKMAAIYDSSEGREIADLSDLAVLPFDPSQPS